MHAQLHALGSQHVSKANGTRATITMGVRTHGAHGSPNRLMKILAVLLVAN